MKFPRLCEPASNSLKALHDFGVRAEQSIFEAAGRIFGFGLCRFATERESWKNASPSAKDGQQALSALWVF